MEALKLRRDSEAAVERALLEIHRRRDRLEQNSRAGARRNIEERSREVRGARLFLESIKTQQEVCSWVGCFDFIWYVNDPFVLLRCFLC